MCDYTEAEVVCDCTGGHRRYTEVAEQQEKAAASASPSHPYHYSSPDR